MRLTGLQSRPSDPSRDFCQWPYERSAEPVPSALRQVALLVEVLERCDHASDLQALLHRIQAFQGRFNTVWGLKSAGKALELELYFYNYDRTARQPKLQTFVDAFPDLFVPGFRVEDRIPFFMASIEVPLTRPNRIDRIDLYTAATGGTRSAGLCHAWDGGSLRLKNLYQFYESARDRETILDAIAASARWAGLDPRPGMLMPGAWGEEIYVLAQKPVSDSVYFARLEIGPAIALCREAGLAPDILHPFTAMHAELAHHRFDIGIDFRAAPDGVLDILKVGLFGLM